MDGSVAQVFAFGGDVEHVAGEEFGDEFFVVVVELFGAVYPTDGVADGGFGFEQGEGQAVDVEDEVGAAFGGPARMLPVWRRCIVLIEIVKSTT
jgi:hypothetical protein